MSLVGRIIRRPCTLRYRSSGAPTDEFNTPDSLFTEVPSVCSLQQMRQGRNEDESLGDLSRTVWLLFLLPSVVPPRAEDEIEVDGVVYQLRGDSWLAYSERNVTPSHIEATLVRAA